MDRQNPDLITGTHITGRFEFLHKTNLAWILKAIQHAPARALLRLLPGEPDWILPDPEDRESFLCNFNLGIACECFNPDRNSRETDLPKPDPLEIDKLLSGFIESKLNRTLFQSTDQFLENLHSRETLRLATTNGCFDILHPGHISILKEAKSMADRLIVAINSDTSVRQFKGAGRPVHSELFRGALLNQLPFVD